MKEAGWGITRVKRQNHNTRSRANNKLLPGHWRAGALPQASFPLPHLLPKTYLPRGFGFGVGGSQGSEDTASLFRSGWSLTFLWHVMMPSSPTEAHWGAKAGEGAGWKWAAAGQGSGERRVGRVGGVRGGEPRR